jgi:hypothetical protein
MASLVFLLSFCWHWLPVPLDLGLKRVHWRKGNHDGPFIIRTLLSLTPYWLLMLLLSLIFSIIAIVVGRVCYNLENGAPDLSNLGLPVNVKEILAVRNDCIGQKSLLAILGTTTLLGNQTLDTTQFNITLQTKKALDTVDMNSFAKMFNSE